MLVAADGPTIYDVATGLIALLSFGVSAYAVRRQVKRETRSVKVTCRYGFPVGAAESTAPDEMITVNVVNDGHRPVDLEQVGFELEDGRQPFVMPLPLDGPVAFPRRLGDGGTATFYFDLAQLDQAEAQGGQRVLGAFVDASGDRYRGSYVKR